MKTCFICKQAKPLSEYYTHPNMGDGHLNKCKVCTREYSRQRSTVLTATDPTFRDLEKIRGRNKYHRLYKGVVKSKPEVSKVARALWIEKYPEKSMASRYSQHVPAPKGSHKHHWSYNEEHFKDVIIVSSDLHAKAHRYLVYDQASKMYKTAEGTLLDTREKHERYINIIKELF